MPTPPGLNDNANMRLTTRRANYAHNTATQFPTRVAPELHIPYAARAIEKLAAPCIGANFKSVQPVIPGR
eukprot:9285572-Pyramimonas_sp.AAC.1